MPDGVDAEEAITATRALGRGRRPGRRHAAVGPRGPRGPRATAREDGDGDHRRGGDSGVQHRRHDSPVRVLHQRQVGQRHPGDGQQNGREDADPDGAQHRPPTPRAPAPRGFGDEQSPQQREQRRADEPEQDHARERHRAERRSVRGGLRIPRPPAQLRPQVVEDLVEAVVDESDAEGADRRARPLEDPERGDHDTGQEDHRRIQGDDVEGHPVVQELHGEHVVHEDHVEMVTEPEPFREVQRRFEDQRVDDGRAPQTQPRRVPGPPPQPEREREGQQRTTDHDRLDDGQGPVLQPTGRAQGPDRIGPFAGDAAQGVRGRTEGVVAGSAHGALTGAAPANRVMSAPPS